jgi:DNA-directed RNA polymerase specialized sigma24 family protein
MINRQNDGSSCFPTTQWTVILEAIKTGDQAVALEALNRFCKRYRPAICNFFLRRRLNMEQAEDYTQAFFASRVFEKWDSRKDFLHKVERRDAGQFRSFLSAILWQFLRDEQRRQSSLKAGGKSLHISISDPEVPIEEICGETFEGFGREFDRELALEIIQRAACGSSNSKYHLAHLRGDVCQAEAAKELGMSENSFKQAHHRFRKRLAEAIKEEVSKLAGPDETEVREEIRYLMSLFA